MKTNANVGDNELSKFVNDYRNLFVYDNSAGLPLNDKLQAALSKYKSIVSVGKVVETKLYFVFSGEISEQNRVQ